MIEMEQNYIDRRRTTSISKAWLIERTLVIIINVSHHCDYWNGDDWTCNKNQAVRFTRWIDTKTILDKVLSKRTMYQYYNATFHTDLIALASLENPEGVVHP